MNRLATIQEHLELVRRQRDELNVENRVLREAIHLAVWSMHYSTNGDQDATMDARFDSIVRGLGFRIPKPGEYPKLPRHALARSTDGGGE